ncbi:LysR family transcriptional regulator [Oceanobacillus senegalensis]|uniref:LysR family transcriptional regulator n=1 Tax=Oceanobacillus senegalensis TaxID=1936063 RepID=UPI000A30D9E7|nr:LysR family transcriptional regulator [Oceanobacillus senegalensis]
MNENQLETFLTIAKFKSYSKAAVILNVTQPTITSRIKALEEILNCELFTRIGHDILLTKEGNMFMDYAKNILMYMQQSKEISNMLKDPLIKVGFSPGYASSFIVELLKTIKSIGGIDIQVVEGFDSDHLNERCLAGEIDLIFTREVTSNQHDIVSEYLFDNNLVTVLPNNHHLCKEEILTLEDLNEETIISFRRQSQLWKQIDQRLLKVNKITRIDVENNEMLLQAVAGEIGIGILPELGIDKSYCSKIEIRKITEISNIPNKVYVQYRKTSQVKDVVKKVIYSIIDHKYNGNGSPYTEAN